jgi:hypothetical protein
MCCVRLLVNVTFAKNATGVSHLEIACEKLFVVSLQLW